MAGGGTRRREGSAGGSAPSLPDSTFEDFALGRSADELAREFPGRRKPWSRRTDGRRSSSLHAESYFSFSASTGCTPFGSAFPLLLFITCPTKNAISLVSPLAVAADLAGMRGQHLVHPARERTLVAHLHQAESLGYGLRVADRTTAPAPAYTRLAA